MPKAKPRKKAAVRRAPAAAPKTARRSPCPVACALDLFGDRWTLLIVRDLVLGRSRFKDFTASPENIPTNILTERLARLLTGGIVQQNPAADGAKRMAYELTEKGRALLPVLKAMRDWGLRWEQGTEAMSIPSKKRLAPDQ
jgi:DNA-binding HxlR family transcriptional regulator